MAVQTFDVVLVYKTPSAALVDYEGEEEWLPLSILPDDEVETIAESTAGTELTVTVPLWKAQQLGWVED